MTGSAERMRHGWSGECAHVRRRAFSHVHRRNVAYLMREKELLVTSFARRSHALSVDRNPVARSSSSKLAYRKVVGAMVV